MIDLKKEHKTLEVRAYEAIKDMIVFGNIQPEVKMTEEGMAAELGVSRTTVKKAFIRLTQEGLLESVSAHGVQVKLMSLEEVMEAFEVREVLEGIAGRIACRILEPKSIRATKHVFQAFRDAGEVLDPDDYCRANFNLHKMIADCCANQSVTRLILSLLVQSRYYSGGYPIQRRSAEAIQEHLDILFALEKRDEVQAETAIRTHLSNIRRHFMKKLQKSGHGSDMDQFHAFSAKQR